MAEARPSNSGASTERTLLEMMRSELVSRHRKPFPSIVNFPPPSSARTEPGELTVCCRRSSAHWGDCTPSSRSPCTVCVCNSASVKNTALLVCPVTFPFSSHCTFVWFGAP